MYLFLPIVLQTALTLLSHCSESGGQIEQLKEFLDLNNMSESEILAAQEELAAILGTNKENQEDEEDENEKCTWPTSMCRIRLLSPDYLGPDPKRLVKTYTSLCRFIR